MNKSIKKIYNHKRPMPVLTSIRRGCNVMDVVWTSKRRRVLTGQFLTKTLKNIEKHFIVLTKKGKCSLLYRLYVMDDIKTFCIFCLLVFSD